MKLVILLLSFAMVVSANLLPDVEKVIQKIETERIEYQIQEEKKERECDELYSSYVKPKIIDHLIETNEEWLRYFFSEAWQLQGTCHIVWDAETTDENDPIYRYAMCRSKFRTYDSILEEQGILVQLIDIEIVPKSALGYFSSTMKKVRFTFHVTEYAI